MLGQDRASVVRNCEWGAGGVVDDAVWYLLETWAVFVPGHACSSSRLCCHCPARMNRSSASFACRH